MPSPSSSNWPEEQRVLSRLFHGRGVELMPGDPQKHEPDAWVTCRGQRILGAEVTRYNPDAAAAMKATQPQAIAAWRDRLWPLLDQARRRHDELERLMVSIDFRERVVPRREQEKEFSQSLVALIWCLQSETPSEKEMFSVRFDGRRQGPFDFGNTMQYWLDDEPGISVHVEHLLVQRTSESWPEWWGPAMRGACVVPDVDVFASILVKKGAKHYGGRSLPLWLVIWCGWWGDVRSNILACGDDRLMDYATLEAFQRASERTSPQGFDRVWLVSADGALRRLRLHPRTPV